MIYIVVAGWDYESSDILLATHDHQEAVAAAAAAVDKEVYDYVKIGHFVPGGKVTNWEWFGLS